LQTTLPSEPAERGIRAVRSHACPSVKVKDEIEPIPIVCNMRSPDYHAPSRFGSSCMGCWSGQAH
jgi:hypothetical protein